jgi:uroporphyrinogen-III synthase
MINVLNTRPLPGSPGDSSTLNLELRAAGFDAIEVPLVELVLLTDALELIGKLSSQHYDGILLSSPNLIPLMRSAGRAFPAPWLKKPWYLIGSRARADVDSLGPPPVQIAFVPQEPSLDGFLHEIPMQSNLRLIHPCSTKTRLEPALFLHKGIDVHNMAVYEPRCPENAGAELEKAWPRLSPQGAVLLASGSAVHHLFVAAPILARTMLQPDGPVPVSIGASTSRALRMYGVERYVQAPTADTAGFLAALHTVFPGKS